jgi:hypothetical protein
MSRGRSVTQAKPFTQRGATEPNEEGMIGLRGRKWPGSVDRDAAFRRDVTQNEGVHAAASLVGDSSQELRAVMLEKLILKHLLFSGRQHIETLARGLALAVESVEGVLKQLYGKGMLDRQEGCPSGYPALVFPRLSERGRSQAQLYAIENAYRGPMPVSLSQYRRVLELQSFRKDPVNLTAVRDAAAQVLQDVISHAHAASALDVGQCILQHSWSEGKTDGRLQRLGSRLGDAIAIPFAVEVNGEIVKVFDPALHLPADPEDGVSGANGSARRLLPDWDHRWAWCRRPLVILNPAMVQGGFEPIYEPDTDTYDAPIQIKSNGGILLLEWGNGQTPANQDLMARWKKALECHQDRLAFGGQPSLAFPFDSLPVFMDIAGIKAGTEISPRIGTRA